MKNYVNEVMLGGIGRTAQICHDALIEMLEELFEGKKYSGLQGRKKLNIFRQNLPIPVDNGEDKDTDMSYTPYIVVRMTGGEIPDDDSPQIVKFNLAICTYDTGNLREGFRDVTNIQEDIIQRICVAPYFGGAFTILKPTVWALQQDDTHPYYFGRYAISCTAPAMTQNSILKEML